MYMWMVAVLFITLTQALGIADPSTPLYCAERTTLSLRESDTKSGCLPNERSLGSNAIKRPKSQATKIHPKVKLRFDVAKKSAAEEGITLYIASGFRSLERQSYLFDRAVKRYGSVDEASKWVLPPNFSSHPQGLALDVNYPGDPRGAKWLEENGYKFGLCRVYDNEWWHFEATTAPGSSCPPRLPHAGVLISSLSNR